MSFTLTLALHALLREIHKIIADMHKGGDEKKVTCESEMTQRPH